jgi:hypothetical protein
MLFLQVCDDRHYTQEVVHVLPRLRFFDSFDLEGMGKTYSYSFRSGNRPAVARSSSAPKQRSQVLAARGKRLPDLPDEVRSLRAGSSAGQPSHEDRRKDFERRLCSALSQRSRLTSSASRQSPPSPLPAHLLTSGARLSTVPPKSGARVRELSSNGANPGAFEPQSDSDEENEMRDVEESIIDLSMIARRSAPRGHTHRAGLPSAEYSERSASPSGELMGASKPGEDSAVSKTDGLHRQASAHSYPATDLPYTAPALIQEWAHHYTTEEMRQFRQSAVPLIDSGSGLLEQTDSLRLRQQLVGVAGRRMRFPEHPDVIHSVSSNSIHSPYLTLRLYPPRQFESLSKQYAGFALGDRSGRSASNRSLGLSQSINAAQSSLTRAGESRSPAGSSRGYHSESELGSRRRSSLEHSARRAGTSTDI